MKPILIASDFSLHDKLTHCLSDEFDLTFTESNDGIIEQISNQKFEFLIVDIKLIENYPNLDNIKQWLQQIKPFLPANRIIILASNEDVRKAVKVVKAGAGDYITYPLDSVELSHVLSNLNHQILNIQEIQYLRDEFWNEEAKTLISTSNSQMKKIFDKIKSVSQTGSSVILYGETGTGKSMYANLIHQHSGYSKGPFIGVHCGAIPDELVESELFGHEKGAFTGAIRNKMGKFELAQNGTIFLDEIGTVPHKTQIKLLQVLQEKKFQRVGGEYDISSNARIISATNENLKDLAEEGKFRSDLYYRLNVFPIEILPLRKRKEDIESLAYHFLKKISLSSNKEIKSIHPIVLDYFQKYQWPGNIRELENLVERAHILETSDTLSPESFPQEIFDEDNDTHTRLEINTQLSLSDARQQVIEDFERTYLKNLLENNAGKIKQSADEAMITTRQLHKLLTKYGIHKEDYKKKIV